MAVLAGVVAVAGLPALAAKVDMAAHRFRAAVFNVLHGLQVRRGHTIGEIAAVFRAMAAKDIRQLRHGLPSRLKIVHQFVDGLGCRIDGLGREVCVEEGGGGSSVAEALLDKP